ncbi:MAG TPA: BamA/TamA family outer membrane protein [Pedobacter sp.]
MLKHICWLSLTFLLLSAGQHILFAQEIRTVKDPAAALKSKIQLKDSTALLLEDTTQVDVNDVIKQVFFKKKKKIPGIKKNGSLVLLPSIGYTPSTGFEFGADVSGTRYFGNPETTTLSVFDAFGAISTNELALIQLRHNIYTAGNKWNIQGSYDLGKTLVLDHGLGTGREMPDTFPIKYTYVKLTENIYKNIFPNFYVGAGLAINLYTKIDEELKSPENIKTHNYVYSLINGFPTNNYFANGLQINLQYNTRDQPYRPYKGLYVDLILRSNQTWLGSEKNSLQLKTELRKYWSLSQKNPEHVLAYWLWASYRLSGVVPYLELPGTGSDTEQRIGRGYTISRFKGPSFFYNETEYRFPITNNKLISGVMFFNMETASNQKNIKLFNYWDPGTGAGLRILFDKHTRSNLCIDYGFGNYGSNGIFVGLNEVF